MTLIPKNRSPASNYLSPFKLKEEIMKNKILPVLIASLSMFNSTAQASIESDVLSSLINSNEEISFSAINHVLVTEKQAPLGPSPGDFFVGNGFGTLNLQRDDIELTYSYNIAGAFTGYEVSEQKLFFNHGLDIPEVTNQLTLYMDTVTTADENNASSYTDGLRIATMEVFPVEGEEGFFSPIGGGDRITFRLIDSDKEQYGFGTNDLFFKISSQILLADIVDGQPQAFNFGAFDSKCGGFDNPYDSCSREFGTGEIFLEFEAGEVVVPVPPALGLFLTGFGLLGWMGKRK